jgi:hypothetical protein
MKMIQITMTAVSSSGLKPQVQFPNQQSQPNYSQHEHGRFKPVFNSLQKLAAFTLEFLSFGCDCFLIEVQKSHAIIAALVRMKETHLPWRLCLFTPAIAATAPEKGSSK